MKKIVFAYIAMLLSSMMLVSFMCCGSHSTIYVANIRGSWDLTYYDTSSIDSTTSPYLISSFDTTYSAHACNNYQFLYNDSVIYTDYTIKPTTIQYGTYALIDTGNTALSGYLILQFPLTNPDTIYFNNNGIQLNFPRSSNHAHVFNYWNEIYTRD